MKPVLAIVGRPNVGKSTIFNQITRTRQALVADLPGLTRDRQYGEAQFEEREFIVIDTGGIGEEEAAIDAHMRAQSQTAIEEADIVILVVDARAGMLGSDQIIADELRRLDKPVFLVANKIDGVNEAALGEFYALGLGDPLPTAASHGRGITSLLEIVTEKFEILPEEEVIPPGKKLAIIGRPNVGKSTLVNRLLGDERVVVFDMPGTTRDSIYIPYEHDGEAYTLIDTAGVRRRGRIGEVVEKFSVIKTLQAVKDADVVVIVLDAHEGIVDQDLNLIGFALDVGRAMVVAINKWDHMERDQKDQIRSELERRLNFIPFVKIEFVSAKYGNGVGNLYKHIERAYDSAMFQCSSSRLTQVLQDATEAHQPPMIGGRRIKMRFAHIGGHNPPVIVVHGNQVSKTPNAYQRYLQNVFRTVFKLEGAPLRIDFKQGDNPYADRKNRISDTQLQKRRRQVQQFKKRDKKR